MFLGDMIKVAYIKDKRDKDVIQTIVLGSSHAMRSFIDDEHSINMGIGSQDLYYSDKLYSYYSKKFTNIKNVVLFFSVFSPGNNIIRGPFYKRAGVYHQMFGFPYNNKQIAIDKNLAEFEQDLNLRYRKLSEYLCSILDDYYPDFRIQPPIEPSMDEKKHSAEAELKLNRSGTEYNYLESILKRSVLLNHRLLIVISPYRNDYKTLFPKSDELFRKLREICAKYNNVNILNLFDNNKFQDKDFFDTDHLNKNGARKATQLIKKALE